MARNAFRKVAPLNREVPDHEHANDHLLLEAIRRYRTKQRLKLAQERRPSAEVAAERIREYAWDLGAERGWSRWMAFAARGMMGDEDGMTTYHTIRRICNGERVRVSPDTVDKIARFTGIPIGVFYDEPEVWNGSGR